MKQAFIIMQIGNLELDNVCKDVFVPALKSVNFDPKRVDKHNKGGLLKSEIVQFIKDSEIILADLTNERPNCYLEIGYTMGLNKFQNLILTAREDHNSDSPNYVKGGPKVHFDLSGYDILFWDPKKLGEFRTELEKKLKRRIANLTTPQNQTITPKDSGWVLGRHSDAMEGLRESGRKGYFEIQMSLLDHVLSVKQSKLFEVAEKAQIRTHGWPIGVILHKTEHRPKPKANGILAKIVTESSYDFWVIGKAGTFYLLKSLDEDSDSRYESKLLFDLLIRRVTESLHYAFRLYTELGVPLNSQISFTLRVGGLKGRRIGSYDRGRIGFIRYASSEDHISVPIKFSLGEIRENIVTLVQDLTEPIFEIFDFLSITEEVYEQIIKDFLKENRLE
jgi:hypothetical protein